jgi:hypothetical protein
MSRASKVTGRSVVIACARMRTLRSSPWRCAKSSEQTTAAAAPQVGGQAIRRVITPGHIIGRGQHLLLVTTLRNSASGLLRRVPAGLGADLGEGVQRRAVLLHVARPAPPK